MYMWHKFIQSSGTIRGDQQNVKRSAFILYETVRRYRNLMGKMKKTQLFGVFKCIRGINLYSQMA